LEIGHRWYFMLFRIDFFNSLKKIYFYKKTNMIIWRFILAHSMGGLTKVAGGQSSPGLA